MPSSIETVRRLALACPGVEEGVCHGTLAFYMRKKLMLRLREDGETLVVAFPKTERADLIDRNPDVFSVTDHYRNYDSVLVSLVAVNDDLLSRMIDRAWRMKAGKRQISAFDATRTKR